ncbi:hypothetical protein FQN54_000832 [Arachnomyces sp. PD_36]|nr:hypothetical protein FQN54_000832 [Arachnomyces sp. PD_36]
MKLETYTMLLAAAAVPATAHYTFSQLIINGNMEGTDWQYIREHQRGYMPTFIEEAAVSEDFRCNQGASSGANTEVFTVHPGDTIALKQAFGGTGMEHPGPGQVYMSLAPGSVQEYDGSGEWFKVYQELVCSNSGPEGFQTTNWCSWSEDRIEFTLPTIPDGEYLVRAEHIPLHGAHAGTPEFYYACAQVKVEGGGGEAPQPTTMIPGVYQIGDEAISFSVWSGFTEYPYIPGPDVISGGETRGSASGM